MFIFWIRLPVSVHVFWWAKERPSRCINRVCVCSLLWPDEQWVKRTSHLTSRTEVEPKKGSRRNLTDRTGRTLSRPVSRCFVDYNSSSHQPIEGSNIHVDYYLFKRYAQLISPGSPSDYLDSHYLVRPMRRSSSHTALQKIKLKII